MPWSNLSSRQRRTTNLKIKPYDAPHIRHPESTRTLMSDAIITLLFIYAMAFYYYGLRAVMLGLVSVAASYITDILCRLVARRKLNFRDLSPIVTGMLLPLMMPAAIDYSIVIAAAVFAILVAKHPFGGVGHNVFNPAAAGFSFVAICFPDKLFTYTLPLQHLPVFGSLAEIATTASPAFTLGIGGLPQYDLVEMALGNFPGPMGATNILVILACLLYLVFRNTVHWESPVFFFLSAGITAFVIRWIASLGATTPTSFTTLLIYMLYELMSGIMLLGGVFLLGDPVTTPKRDWSKVAFAVVAGIVTMLFRRYGGFEEGFTFAVLLMNATVWGFDMLGERLASHVRRRRTQ